MSTALGWCLDNLHTVCRRSIGALTCGCNCHTPNPNANECSGDNAEEWAADVAASGDVERER